MQKRQDMELTRKQVIEILEKADSTVYKEPKTKTAQALEYAIADVKLVSQLSDFDLLKPIAEVKDIDYEGTYIKLSDLQDYIHEVENGRN